MDAKQPHFLPERLQYLLRQYPGQFWLMFAGMLVSTIGSSMIWPFLMIYVSGKLQLPLTTTASLMTINAAASLLSSFIAGPITDRLGRKWVMVFSLVANGLGYFFLSRAETLPVFALLMVVQGAVNPVYRIGSDAMMADLIPAEKRTDAYSLLRMSNNLGIAVGPAIGGFVAGTSYALAFYAAAIGLSFYGLLIAFFARETLQRGANAVEKVKERFGGYGRVFRDRPFVYFCIAFTLMACTTALAWIIMPVHATSYFGVPESQYGFIPTTNALMVVLLQYAVTLFTRRHRTLRMVALGAAVYSVAVFTVAFASGFWGFWISMVILTIGELIVVPTATTYVANIAPADMRGRYMSLYALTWSVASGVGPVFGGFLSDNFSHASTWYGGAVLGFISVAMFLLLSRGKKEEYVPARAS